MNGGCQKDVKGHWTMWGKQLGPNKIGEMLGDNKIFFPVQLWGMPSKCQGDIEGHKAMFGVMLKDIG
jgi:hypothetical protein